MHLKLSQHCRHQRLPPLSSRNTLRGMFPTCLAECLRPAVLLCRTLQSWPTSRACAGFVWGFYCREDHCLLPLVLRFICGYGCVCKLERVCVFVRCALSWSIFLSLLSLFISFSPSSLHLGFSSKWKAASRLLNLRATSLATLSQSKWENGFFLTPKSL